MANNLIIQYKVNTIVRVGALVFLLIFVKNSILYAQQSNAELLEIAKSLRSSNADSSLQILAHVYNTSNNKTERTYAEYLSGLCYYRIKQLDTAYYLLNKVIDDIDEASDLGSAYLTIGKIFIRQENFADAHTNLTLALAQFEAANDKPNQFYTLNDLGINHYNQGDYTKALHYYLTAMDRAMEFGMNDRVVRLLSNILGVYTMLKQNDKALEIAREAIALSHKTNDPIDLKTAATSMSYIQKLIGQPDSAIFYSEMALEYAKNAGDFFSVAWQYSDQGDLYQLKNDMPSAISAYKTALNHLQNSGTAEDVATLQMKIAEVFIVLGKYDSARVFAASAHTNGIANKSKWPIYRSSEILAEISLKQKDPMTASVFFQKALAYKDSIFNDKEQQQFANQRVKLETLEKVKTIESLKKQAQIDALQQERLLLLLLAVLSIGALAVGMMWMHHRNKQKMQLQLTKQLQLEVKKANEDLNNQTLHMMHVNNSLSEVEKELKMLPTEKKSIEVQHVLKKINIGKAQEKDWENFNKYFKNVHSEFYNQLIGLSDKLTLHEQRICALIKMNLTNHEISSLLNIETKSVKMLKYRIKKKLELDESTDLYKYIQEIGPIDASVN